MSHKITCAVCFANKFVDVVPDIFICDHLNPQDHPGMRWYVCPNCTEGSWIESITHKVKCPICEKRNSVRDLGTVVTSDSRQSGASMLSKTSPGDFVDYKSESEKQTEILQSILALLENRGMT